MLAVDETSVYVGNSDGRLAKFARGTGDVVNVVDTGTPVSRVMVGGGAMWTLHTPPDMGPADGNYRAVRRDPNTLSQAGEQPPQVLLTDLFVAPDGTGWVAMGNALLPFPFDSGTAAGTTQSDDLVDVDGTILTGRDTGSAWLALPYGETVHVTEDEAERRDFHYDRLRGVVTTNSATWFLVERDDWLFGSADDARRSFLVRWDG